MATPFGTTVDGFETQLATNHLGHFALLTQIAPLLVDGARLVVLSSQAHRVADVDLDDPNFERQPYDAFVAYGRSKTANALFAVEFDRRHRARGVRAAAVMPGNSMTDLPRHLAPELLQGLFETVGKARSEAGLPPPALESIPQVATTSKTSPWRRPTTCRIPSPTACVRMRSTRNGRPHCGRRARNGSPPRAETSARGAAPAPCRRRGACLR